MVCRLVGAKPLSEPMLEYCSFEPQEQMFQWKLNQISYIFIQENVFENVDWKVAANMSRPQLC